MHFERRIEGNGRLFRMYRLSYWGSSESPKGKVCGMWQRYIAWIEVDDIYSTIDRLGEITCECKWVNCISKIDGGLVGVE